MPWVKLGHIIFLRTEICLRSASKPSDLWDSRSEGTPRTDHSVCDDDNDDDDNDDDDNDDDLHQHLADRLTNHPQTTEETVPKRPCF